MIKTLRFNNNIINKVIAVLLVFFLLSSFLFQSYSHAEIVLTTTLACKTLACILASCGVIFAYESNYEDLYNHLKYMSNFQDALSLYAKMAVNSVSNRIVQNFKGYYEFIIDYLNEFDFISDDEFHKVSKTDFFNFNVVSPTSAVYDSSQYPKEVYLYLPDLANKVISLFGEYYYIERLYKNTYYIYKYYEDEHNFSKINEIVAKNLYAILKTSNEYFVSYALYDRDDGVQSSEDHGGINVYTYEMTETEINNAFSIPTVQEDYGFMDFEQVLNLNMSVATEYIPYLENPKIGLWVGEAGANYYDDDWLYERGVSDNFYDLLYTIKQGVYDNTKYQVISADYKIVEYPVNLEENVYLDIPSVYVNDDVYNIPYVEIEYKGVPTVDIDLSGIIDLLRSILEAILSLPSYFLELLKAILQAILSIPQLLIDFFPRVLTFFETIVTLLTSLLDMAKDFFTIPDDISINFEPLAIALSEKFPFSIPFDFYNLVKNFSFSPKEPNLIIDLSNSFFNINHKIDLSIIQTPLLFFKYIACAWFIYILISKTKSFIKW